MSKKIKRAAYGGLSTALLLLLVFCPGLPWSARYRHVMRRTMTKMEMKVSAWQGERPRLVSLSGNVILERPRRAPLRGGQIEALDSTSGWAALTDKRGEFVLRDVTWHPRATYTLIIAANEYKSRQIQVVATATYPEDGVIELGELDFGQSCQINTDNLPGRNSISYLEYDLKNDLFYREIVAELTEGKQTDEEKLQALSRYVAIKLDAVEIDDRIESPRRILEKGSAFCGKLALALATLAEAADYRARLLDLIDGEPQPNAHMVTEIYYGDRWHLYDATAGLGFHDRNDRIASYRDLRLDPQLVSSAPPNHLPAAIDKRENSGLGIYQSGLHHYYYLKRIR